MNKLKIISTLPFIVIALFAFTINSYFTALPFYVKSMDGGNSETGIAFASYFFCYLMLCLYQNKSAKNLSHKLTSTAIILLVICLSLLQTTNLNNQPSVFYVISALLGLIQASLWPTLMSMIVGDAEGALLNEKLIHFNLSWAIPMLTSPLLVALLLAKDVSFISWFIITLLLLVLLTLTFIPFTLQQKSNPAPSNSPSPQSYTPKLAFLAASALIGVSIVVMLYKSHLADVMINKLGMLESHFALVVTCVNLGTVFVFFIQQRWQQWQWRKLWLFNAQIVAVMAALSVFYENLILLMLGAFAAGIAHGFVYGAHQFYCSATNTNRQQAMSKHEIIQSSGIISGSILAGFAGEVSFSMPYIMAVVIVTVLLLSQWLISIKTQQTNPATISLE